ncbi:MAG TPA: hypothetical protein VE262_22615 [Blastocatellia bacterium]|nr:hypothetical protein [Blastocatellia bacterium]
MTDHPEPWDNSYVLDGDTEALLRRLLIAPLTQDQVVRSCLKEVHLLLPPEDKAKLESKMADGAQGLPGLLLQPFSNAVAEWLQMREELQQSVDWEEVPAQQRELSEKRADYILRYATRNGWVVREGESGEWQITEQGREVIQRGGFYMR